MGLNWNAMTVAEICKKMTQGKALRWQLVLPKALALLRTAQMDLMLLQCSFQMIVSFVKTSLFLRRKTKSICWQENEPLKRDKSTGKVQEILT